MIDLRVIWTSFPSEIKTYIYDKILVKWLCNDNHFGRKRDGDGDKTNHCIPVHNRVVRKGESKKTIVRTAELQKGA
jgi:hypothetical protein